MSRRARALALGALIAVGAAACVKRPQPAPRPAEDLALTLGFAQGAAGQGRFQAADSALGELVRTHPTTPEAREATYWRGVMLLNPQNAAANRAAAVEQFDRYLADTVAFLPHAAEARVMRRLAVLADSVQQQLQSLLSTDRAAGSSPRPATPREEELQREIARLKDQLDKTNAEMDRLKRRLTARPPG